MSQQQASNPPPADTETHGQAKPTHTERAPGEIPARLISAVKRQKQYAQDFRKARLTKVADELDLCTTHNTLVCCSGCGHRWWVKHRCRQRVCPICSYRKMKEREEYVTALCKQMAYPKFITLTQPIWKDKPQDGIKFLRDAFNKLRDTDCFKKVTGGAYQIELKQKPEGWHIHIHIIADAPYIPYQHLFSTWRKLINCSVPQVTIIAAKTPQQQKYVAKYAAKAADYDGTTDVVAWYEATKGARLWATFGTWYNATLDDLLNIDTPEPPPRQCPQCGGTGNIFYARDGPFLFKNEVWQKLKGTWLEDGESVYQEIQEWKEALGNALGL